MTLWQFADRHPWWALVYLWSALATVESVALAALRARAGR
jgi:hypothetical protein